MYFLLSSFGIPINHRTRYDIKKFHSLWVLAQSVSILSLSLSSFRFLSSNRSLDRKVPRGSDRSFHAVIDRSIDRFAPFFLFVSFSLKNRILLETVSKRRLFPIFDLDLFVCSAASSTEQLERSYDAPIGEWFVKVNSVASNNANRKYGGVACLAVVDHLAKRARFASAILTRLKRLSLPKFRV